MSNHKQFYNDQYQNVQADVYRQIRAETYGEDIGQTGWNTTDDCHKYLSWMVINETSHMLEVACGSGGTTVFMSQETGAQVTGIDVNADAVAAAFERASEAEMSDKVAFQVMDASQALLFAPESFDAIFCNDSINHLPDRLSVLQDWYRLLKPGGRLLYTDPIIVTGMMSNEEIATRSSIGFYLYTPIGENERLIKLAGFELVRSENVSNRTTDIAQRWHDARLMREDVLVQFESQEGYEKTQRFLALTHELSRSGRLSRFAYLVRKPHVRAARILDLAKLSRSLALLNRANATLF